MAFIELLPESENTSTAYLVNTDHFVSITLTPYTGGAVGLTHTLTLALADRPDILATFTSLAAARAAYDRLNTYLNTDSVSIPLY